MSNPVMPDSPIPFSDSNLAKVLKDKLQSRDPGFEPLRLRQAKVTASPGGGVVTINLAGGTTDLTGCHYLASYSPTVNDIVWALQLGPMLLILGKLA